MSAADAAAIDAAPTLNWKSVRPTTRAARASLYTGRVTLLDEQDEWIPEKRYCAVCPRAFVSEGTGRPPSCCSAECWRELARRMG